MVIFNVILHPSINSVSNLIGTTISSMGFLAVFMISRRWNKAFVTLLPALFFLQLAVTFNKTIIEEKYGDKDHLEVDEWTFYKHQQLMMEAVVLIFTFIFSVLFFSPSLKYTVLIYSPIYAGMHLFHMWTKYDMKDVNVLSLNIAVVVIIIF